MCLLFCISFISVCYAIAHNRETTISRVCNALGAVYFCAADAIYVTKCLKYCKLCSLTLSQHISFRFKKSVTLPDKFLYHQLVLIYYMYHVSAYLDFQAVIESVLSVWHS